MEVVQFYIKKGNIGDFSISYGTPGRIVVNHSGSGAPYLINHVHPSGNPIPSSSDLKLLKTLQEIQKANGMPIQKSSQIIPIDIPNSKFNINTTPLGK